MGSSTQKTTSSTAPSNPDVNPTVSMLLKGVQSAYKDGPQVFDKSLYAGMGPTTEAGMSGLLSASQQPNYFGAASDFAGGLLNSGGLSGGMGSDISRARGIADNAMAPSLTENSLMGVARGDFLGNMDPEYQKMVDRIANGTAADINASMGANGAFGSNVHVGALADEIGALRTNANVANRNFEIGRQQQALQAIEAARQQGIGNALGAGQQAFGMGQQGIANAMGAGAALPGLFEAGLLPSQTQLAVGQMQDADAQAQLQGEYDLFSRTANADTDLLAKLSSILAGNAAAGGSTTTTTSPTTPWWQVALGTALGTAARL